MKYLFVLFFGLFFSVALLAQNAELDTANGLYAKGQYRQAAEIYEQVIANQGVAPAVFYNLGNAYYKMNETARSILNYERALRLAPNYTDARRNLAFAQTKIVDNVPVAGSFFLMHWLDKLINLLGSNAWLWLSVAMLVLALLLGFVFLFGKSLIFRKISFYSTIILLVFCFVGGVFSGIQKKRMLNHNEAIVINEVVTVKSAPDKSGTDIFQLHEGTKVTVVDTLGAWTEIRLGNRNTGWLESYLIEKI